MVFSLNFHTQCIHNSFLPQGVEEWWIVCLKLGDAQGRKGREHIGQVPLNQALYYPQIGGWSLLPQNLIYIICQEQRMYRLVAQY